MATLSPNCVVANQNAATNSAMLNNFGKKEREEFIRRMMERDAKHAGAFDIGLDIAINGMLSGTGTYAVNVISMFLQSMLKLSNASIGAMTDAMGVTHGGREWRQVRAMWDAALEGFSHDAMYFREGFLKGYSLERDVNVRQLGMGKADFKKFTRDTMGKDPEELNIDEVEDFMLDMMDYMHNSIGKTRVGGTPIEGIVRFPTKFIVGIDEFGKARFRRMSMNQLASKAASEDSAKGLGSYEDLYKQYKKDINDPQVKDEKGNTVDFESRWDKKVQFFTEKRNLMLKEAGLETADAAKKDLVKEGRMAVELIRNDALFNAFQQKLAGNPRKVQEFRHKHPAFALFAPFIKTPWNIIKEGYNYLPIVPALRIQGKGALSKLNVDLRTNVVPLHGTPEKMSYDELLPRQIIGMSMFATIGMLYDDERVTGSIPRDPAERQRWKDQGIMPYSVKIGDTWMSYHRFEPLATPLSMAADLFDFTKEYLDDDDINTEEGLELIGNLMYAVKANITSKTFLEGIHTLTEAIVDPNSNTMEGLLETALRPMTPAIVAQTAKMIDGYERQTEDMWERLQSRIPVFRHQLPKQYGAYGDPKTTDFAQALTSVKFFSEDSLTPLQSHLREIKWDKGGVRNNLKGVKLSSDQLGRLRQLNAERMTPMLENVIQSPVYQKASDSMKRKILDRVSTKIRSQVGKMYANELRQTDPEFARKFLSAWYKSKGLEDEMPDNLRD